MYCVRSSCISSAAAASVTAIWNAINKKYIIYAYTTYIFKGIFYK